MSVPIPFSRLLFYFLCQRTFFCQPSGCRGGYAYLLYYFGLFYGSSVLSKFFYCRVFYLYLVGGYGVRFPKGQTLRYGRVLP